MNPMRTRLLASLVVPSAGGRCFAGANPTDPMPSTTRGAGSRVRSARNRSTSRWRAGPRTTAAAHRPRRPRSRPTSSTSSTGLAGERRGRALPGRRRRPHLAGIVPGGTQRASGRRRRSTPPRSCSRSSTPTLGSARGTSAGGELVVAVVVGHELGRPAVIAVVVRLQEATQPVVQPRRTNLVACRGIGHLLFHLSFIGIAVDFFETAV